MSISMRSPYEEPESSASRWVVIFVLLSLLAHAVIIAVVLLLTRFLPVPKMTAAEPASPTVSLSLLPSPPAPPKKIFIPTNPEADAPHKDQLVESANDHKLTSKNQTARAPDSILPDVTGHEHAPNLTDSPLVKAQPKQEVSSTPPTPRQAKPEKPAPPQPTPQKATTVKPEPPQPKSKPMPPTPPKKTPPQVDPLTGLPVLPPLNVPTMAPPNSASQPLAPSASMMQQAASVHGAIGLPGDNSPASMATELGKYKQYLYSVVGTWWYPDINQNFGTVGVGSVHIQFTIHSDGSITDVTVLEGNNLQILRDISRHSLIAPAPYKAFSPAMIQEVGDSFTYDFTFSAY